MMHSSPTAFRADTATPRGSRSLKLWHLCALLPIAALLAGCNPVVLKPSGDIAAQQRDLLVLSTYLMLLIIVPVMLLVVFFAWKYRASNKDAEYEPDWHHSTQLELVIWAAPLLIIISLGALTWVGTHLLDPYRPLDRIAHDKPVTQDMEPLEVEVVALDWKWLFIYPQYGVATVNELAAPVDRQIRFKLTSSSVMNAFYVPAMAGMIYAMPGMETKLHGVINAAGVYDGFSSNYSGHGFSGMRFKFHGLGQQDFDAWVAKIRDAGQSLDRSRYLELERPSEHVPPTYFSAVDADLYRAILNLCVEPGKMCMSEMMALDARGGSGTAAGQVNVSQLTYDKYGRRGSVSTTALGPAPVRVNSICSVADVQRIYGLEPMTETASLANQTPLRGRGLQRDFAPLGMSFGMLLAPAAQAEGMTKSGDGA